MDILEGEHNKELLKHFVPKIYDILRGIKYDEDELNIESSFSEFLDLIILLWKWCRSNHWWRIEYNLLENLPRINTLFDVKAVSEKYVKQLFISMRDGNQ